MNQARRQRLDAVNSGLPSVMWWVLLPGAIGCVLLCLLFRADNAWYQGTLVVSLAGFLSMNLFVIVALDRPFQGDIAIGSDSYVLVYDQLMKRQAHSRLPGSDFSLCFRFPTPPSSIGRLQQASNPGKASKLSVQGPAQAFAIVILLATSVASARAEGPAVSALNGKISAEGGVTGIDGYSSGVATTKGSISAPLGYSFGVQLDAVAGTAFNTGFGGGTAHLFWRDPEIGLFGPVVSMAGGGGVQLGWYGAEAEIYARRFTFTAWGGYHDAVNNAIGRAVSTGYYGGAVTAYPTLNLALTIGATSEFNRFIGNSTIEFQPDLFARRNMSFFVDGEAANHATYSVTAGIRFYFGADKPLIRRHREDDPMTSGRPSVLADLLEPSLRVIVNTGYGPPQQMSPGPPFSTQPPGTFVFP